MVFVRRSSGNPLATLKQERLAVEYCYTAQTICKTNNITGPPVIFVVYRSRVPSRDSPIDGLSFQTEMSVGNRTSLKNSRKSSCDIGACITIMHNERPAERPSVLSAGIDALGSNMDPLDSWLSEISIPIELVYLSARVLSCDDKCRELIITPS